MPRHDDDNDECQCSECLPPDTEDWCTGCDNSADSCTCDRRTMCTRCGVSMNRRRDGITRCRVCSPPVVGVRFVRRETPVFHEAKTFKANPSRRFVSCEVEVCGAHGNAQQVNEVVAAWQSAVVSDGSLPQGGFEITTAPTNGDKFVEHMTVLSAALREAAGWVDARAGMHVHIDARDFHYWDLRRLIMLYQRVEPALFAMVPPGRRRSSFCEPCGNRYMDAIRLGDDAAKGLAEAEAQRAWTMSAFKKRLLFSLYSTTNTRGARGWHRDKIADQQPTGDKYAAPRYRAMNLHSWMYRGTIEFRIPPGTVRKHKMIGWGTLFAGFLDSVPHPIILCL